MGGDIIAEKTTLLGTPISRGEQLGMLGEAVKIDLNQSFRDSLVEAMRPLLRAEAAETEERQGARQIFPAYVRATQLQHSLRHLLQGENTNYYACLITSRGIFELTMYLAYLAKNLYSKGSLENNGGNRGQGRDFLQSLIDEEVEEVSLKDIYGNLSTEAHGENLWESRGAALMSVRDGKGIVTRFYWVAEELQSMLNLQTALDSYLNHIMLYILRKAQEGPPVNPGAGGRK